MAHYRILSLDGGGIRGTFTARLLANLEARVPGFLGEVDLIAGTSTGGIIALGLAKGLAPQQLVDLYVNHATEIFRDSWFDDIRDLGKITGADYSSKPLKRVLEQAFGSATTLGQLSKHVLIPAFDLDNEGADGKTRTWKPKFFHNFKGTDSDAQELAVDVAMYTSAAPTYFPSYDGYIDGGVVANNPSLAALAQAMDARAGKQSLGDICLLSLSTGVNPTYIKGQTLNWGYAQWAKPLLSLMIDGVMGVADFQCQQLLDQRYHRLEPILPRAIALDDAAKAGELRDMADGVPLTSTVKWLQSVWNAP